MTSLLHLSWFNRLAVLAMLALAGTAAVQGKTALAVGLVVAAAIAAASVVVSTRRSAGTLERVSAAQPGDERERVLSTQSFALVGQVAVIGAMALFVARQAELVRAIDATQAGVALLAVWVVAVLVTTVRG